MTRLNEQGYLEKRPSRNVRKAKLPRKGRDWWLVKYTKQNQGGINLGHVSFKKEWIGKRVRIKIEEVTTCKKEKSTQEQ